MISKCSMQNGRKDEPNSIKPPDVSLHGPRQLVWGIYLWSKANKYVKYNSYDLTETLPVFYHIILWACLPN